MIRLEKALDSCLARLEERCRVLHPELDWSAHDDVESIASGSMMMSGPSASRGVRFASQERETERLRNQVTELEEENQTLRRQLDELQRLVRAEALPVSDTGKENRSGNERLQLSEGEVWSQVRRSIS
jgi:hypothetical protein